MIRNRSVVAVDEVFSKEEVVVALEEDLRGSRINMLLWAMAACALVAIAVLL